MLIRVSQFFGFGLYNVAAARKFLSASACCGCTLDDDAESMIHTDNAFNNKQLHRPTHREKLRSRCNRQMPTQRCCLVREKTMPVCGVMDAIAGQLEALRLRKY